MSLITGILAWSFEGLVLLTIASWAFAAALLERTSKRQRPKTCRHSTFD